MKASDPQGRDRSPHAEHALTPTQQRELLSAFRQHPCPYDPPRRAVAKRMATLGLFEAGEDGFRLSRAGLDRAARMHSQAIIDLTSARQRPIHSPEQPAPARQAVGVPPRDWPFPCSAHDWR